MSAEVLNRSGVKERTSRQDSTGVHDLDPGDRPFVFFTLPQVRSEYDEAALNSLMKSMESESGIPPFFVQINPLQVAEFDNTNDLVGYLVDHADFYGVEPDLDIFRIPLNAEGLWEIGFAGHRRSMVIDRIGQKHGYQVKAQDVSLDRYRNISFVKARKLQVAENEHERVSPTDEAEEIRRFYEYLTRKHDDGKPPTYAELGEMTGFTEDKLRSGLRFTALPDRIKNEFTAGLITYQEAVESWRLLAAAKQYYLAKCPEAYGTNVDNGPEDLATAAEHLTLTTLNRVKEVRMRSGDRMGIIKGKIASLREAVGIDALFDYDDDALMPLEVSRQMRKSLDQVGAYALRVIQQLLETGHRDPKYLDRIEHIAALAAEARATADGRDNGPVDERTDPNESLF